MVAAVEPWIGTLNERPLHACLKRWYARPGDLTEVAVDGFVIDLVRGDLLIEVRARRMAQQMAYCLRFVDVIVPVGKRGHAVEYRLGPTRPVRTSRPPRPETVGGSVR